MSPLGASRTIADVRASAASEGEADTIVIAEIYEYTA
jgi:hypothetical protein